jgi:glycerol kinase
MNPFEKVLHDIGHGVEWTAKELGKAFADLPKIITLTDDAEKAASDALPKTIAVVQDAGQLATASVKDSGQFVADLTALGAAIAAAYTAKAFIADDLSVATAFEKLCADFNESTFADLIAAWNKLVTDTKALDATVIADLQKLESDAKQ